MSYDLLHIVKKDGNYKSCLDSETKRPENVSSVLKPLMSHTLVLKTPARGVSYVYRYFSRYLYIKLDIHHVGECVSFVLCSS